MAITDRIESMHNHIGEAYDITEEKGGTLARLPKEYQEVDYIESHGNEHIDTGYKPNQNSSIELDIQMISGKSANVVRFFETRNIGESVTESFGILNFADGNNLFQFRYYGSTAKSKFHLQNDIWYNIKTNKEKLYLDDELVITATSRNFQCIYNLVLYKFNGPAGIEGENVFRTRKFKIFDDMQLVRDYIPCYRKSDNAVGLYDLVSNTFFENSGTGAFTYGSEVTTEIDKNLENLSQAISTIDTHTEELEEMRSVMQKPTLNVFSNVMSETAYSEFKDALKDYSSAFLKYMEYNSNEEVGTSEVKLENALSTNALNLSIKGNTKQNIYNGYQLLNIEDVNTTTKNGLTYTIKDGIITLNGTATSEVVIDLGSVLNLNSSESYSENLIGFNSSFTHISLQMYRGGRWSNFIQQNFNNNINGITTTGYSSFYFNFVVNSGTYNNDKFMPMFVNGTIKPTAYEPYTGGIQSPNPDYPQEIKTLDEATVYIRGKQLFNKNIGILQNKYITSGGSIFDGDGQFVQEIYIKVKPNTSYTFSANIQDDYFRMAEYNESKKFIERKILANPSRKATYTTTENTHYIRISCAYANINTLQLVEGTESTPYEEFKETEIELPLQGNELTSNDTLSIGYDGNTYIEKKWGKVVLDGDINKLELFNNVFYKMDIANSSMRDDVTCKSNYYLAKRNVFQSSFAYDNGNNTCCFRTNQNQLFIRDDRFSTATDMNNWLKSQYNAGTPVTIYYELANPEIVELENTQISLFPDTNNISVEANVEPSELKVKYAIDIFSEQPQLVSEVAENE